MLAQRILTAALLIPLVVGGVLFLPTLWLGILFGLVILLGAKEWANMSGIGKGPMLYAYLLLVASTLVCAALVVTHSELLFWLFACIAGGWLVGLITLLRTRQVATTGAEFNPGRALLGLLVLVPAWLALVSLHGRGEHGPALVLFVLVLIWVADSGAYFSGRQWGRVKLAPAISPGKTREGVYGALAGSLICGVGLAWFQPELGLLAAIPLCVITCLASVEGDLFESLIKRQAGVKDSGNLLPGHGGVLDRIDSITSAAPIFLFGLMLLEVLG